MNLDAPRIAETERLRFKMRQSPVTAALIIAFVAVFVASWFDLDRRIFATFAKIDDRVREGELWRLFTASFLHGGLLHVWFNGMALASLGPAIERTYGKLRYLLVFLIGGAAGMAASVAFVPEPSVGASAGIFALLGLLLAYALRSRSPRLAPHARRFLITQVLVVVGLNVAIGLLADFIDNAAHLGGLAGGFVLGFLIRPTAPLFPETAQQPGAPAERGAGASPPSTPTSSASVGTARRPGRSYMGWAGQRWRMAAMFLGLAPLVLFLFSGDGQLTPWPLLSAVIGFMVAAFARCPGCRKRVFWWCLSELPANRALQTALEAQSCPICGYPDAREPTGEVAPPTENG